MFGDSSQEFFSAVAFLRARVTTSSGPQTEIAFVLGKAYLTPMKVMTIAKLELQAALLATRLNQEICRALTVHDNKVSMWTDSTTVLQWLNSSSKQPKFVANPVCHILEHTIVDEWNQVLKFKEATFHTQQVHHNNQATIDNECLESGFLSF